MSEAKKLKIDPEFYSHLQRPTAEEWERFEAVLLEEGIRDPIVVWKGKDIIVGGMTRFEIAQKHALPFKTVEIHFENRNEVKVWISRNQITQRNLAEHVAKYHIGLVYNQEKEKHGGSRRGDNAEDGAAGEDAGTTAETLATELGSTPAKVRHAAKFTDLVHEAKKRVPEIMDAINSGKKLSTAVLNKIVKADTKLEARAILKAATEPKPKGKGKKENAPTDDAADDDDEVEEIKVHDGLGKLVKDARYNEVFTDAPEFDTLLREARALRTKIKALSQSGGGVNIHFENDGPLAAAFKLVEAELRDKKPVTLCKKCKGEKVIEKDGKTIECDGPCMGNGFVDHFHHNRK